MVVNYWYALRIGPTQVLRMDNLPFQAKVLYGDCMSLVKKTNINSKNHQDIFCIKIQTSFNGFHHCSHYIDYFSMNCVPQLAKRGVVVSDSPVPVAKIDTACTSNISIFTRRITKMLVLT
jgi:hypothetical protein